MRVAPPTSGGGAEAIGETASVGGAAPGPTVSTIISEPTPVGQDKKAASGLAYATLKEGTGASVKPGQTVKVNYVGRLEDGTEFDSSAKGGPIEFPVGVGRLIKGWEEGIPGMKVGEKRRLIVPGHMGYGAQGQPPTIPPNAVLVFEVEVLEAK